MIAEETGVANVADPLGGSYFVEKLTDQVEAAAWEYIHKIDAMGGIVKAVEEGYPQREIARAAFEFQREVDSGRRSIVGVNKYVTPDEGDNIPTLEDRARGRAAARSSASKAFRGQRDEAAVERALAGGAAPRSRTTSRT